MTTYIIDLALPYLDDQPSTTVQVGMRMTTKSFGGLTKILSADERLLAFEGCQDQNTPCVLDHISGTRVRLLKGEGVRKVSMTET